MNVLHTRRNMVCDVLDGAPLPENALRIESGVAFGPAAIRFLQAMPSDLSIVACDGHHAELALAEAVRRRREGIRTFVAPLTPDNQAAVGLALAPQLLRQFSTPDDLRGAFEALAVGALQHGGVGIDACSYWPGPTLQTMRDFGQLGDALLVRSYAEASRFETFYKRQRQYRAVAPGFDATVPDVRPDRDADRIVVWAPHAEPADLAILAYALSEFHVPAIFISRGRLPYFHHEWQPLENAAAVVRRAAVIVDADIASPAASIAFAGRGFGVACARTSGAAEYVQGALSYDARDFRSIIAAVSRARADRRTTLVPRQAMDEHLRQTLSAAEPPFFPAPPLVSIIIPTYNRPDYLRKNLAAFRKQTYPNFEVVVVNDAGTPVDDIVAAFPFARLLTNAANMGVVKTCNVGFRAARGEYLGVVADDDALYPDHISTVMAGIRSSGLAIGHGNIIVSLNTRLPGDGTALLGYLLAYEGSHDRTEALWAMPIHAAGYIVRKDVLAGVGYFSEHTKNNSDHDLTLKLSEQSDFAHCSTVTGEMRYRDDGTNDSARAGEAHALEVAAVLASHLPPNRPLIEQRQADTVRGVLAGMQRPVFYEPHIRVTPPLPNK